MGKVDRDSVAASIRHHLPCCESLDAETGALLLYRQHAPSALFCALSAFRECLDD